MLLKRQEVNRRRHSVSANLMTCEAHALKEVKRLMAVARAFSAAAECVHNSVSIVSMHLKIVSKLSLFIYCRSPISLNSFFTSESRSSFLKTFVKNHDIASYQR